jgi:hypothetical protein
VAPELRVVVEHATDPFGRGLASIRGAIALQGRGASSGVPNGWSRPGEVLFDGFAAWLAPSVPPELPRAGCGLFLVAAVARSAVSLTEGRCTETQWR